MVTMRSRRIDLNAISKATLLDQSPKDSFSRRRTAYITHADKTNRYCFRLTHLKSLFKNCVGLSLSPERNKKTPEDFRGSLQYQSLFRPDIRGLLTFRTSRHFE